MADTHELKRFIHKLHLRTFDKVWNHVHERYPNVTEQAVKDILKSFIRDPKHLNQKQYYNKIFSDHPHAWQMDLLDNKGQTSDYNAKADMELHEMSKQYPLYWFMFVNVNTRFAVAYPIYHKTNESILDTLMKFVSEHNCTSLTSDKESAFTSPLVTNYLRVKNISQFIVLNGNHTSMAIMDSFIRHLRDMNITNEKSKYQSHHSKYRNFSVHRMTRLLNTYNNTIHSAIQMKPIDMESDVRKERQYIAYCLIRRSKTKKHDIPIGHYVRIVLSKEMMNKRRFKVSREAYKITGRDGNNYLVSAADNMLTSLPRHRLIDIGENKPDKYKFADTIPFDEGFRKPTAIINKEPNDKKLLVQYGNDGAGYMRSVDIRRHHPQLESSIEKDFNARTTIHVNPRMMIRLDVSRKN